MTVRLNILQFLAFLKNMRFMYFILALSKILVFCNAFSNLPNSKCVSFGIQNSH